MSELFQMRDAEDAQEFLRTFYANTRRTGEKCYAENRVQALSETRAGIEYSAKVLEGSGGVTVTLEYDEDGGWDGICSCPAEYGCAHAYAAMKALLAENSLAAVRDISTGAMAGGGVTSSKSGTAALAANGKTKPSGRLADLASAALERGLTRDELAFCKKLSSIHSRCMVHGRITYWDLSDLGIGLIGSMWSAPFDMPEYPETELDLWLNIAQALVDNGGSVPKFLEPITDLTQIRERMAQLKRRKEIEQWKANLRNMTLQESWSGDLEAEDIDVRLAFSDGKAVLEWKRPGKEFVEMKAKHLRDLISGMQEGRAQLSAESQMLCTMVQSVYQYSQLAEIKLDGEIGQATLAQVLRTKSLESRTVSEAGKVLIRVAEPLRWNVVAPTTDDGSYRFKLICHDGSNMGDVICAIPGHPSLYVTRCAVYQGPRPQRNLLEVGKETKIPAAAVETRAGLQFITTIGVEIPQRIRDRVRHVPLQVTIECELGRPHRMSSTENCYFKVCATSPDGKHSETWVGERWNPRESMSATQRKADEEALILYDRSVAQKVAALMEPLSLKREGYGDRMLMRVTKKFPEVFVPWLQSLPPQVEISLDGELASFSQNAVSGHVRLAVEEAAIDWFDLSVVLDVSDTTLSPEEIKLLLNAKGSYVRLGDKGWKRLQFDLTAEDDERLANLGLNPHELTAEPQRLHALQLADAAAKRFLPEHQALQIQRRAAEIRARVTPALPQGVSAELRPYQVEGFHFLAYLQANRFGGILADDMGLGKTLQTLSWLLWLREQPGASGASLVVCPKSVMDNWQAEALRFTPGLRVKRWPSSQLESFHDELGEADLHVINYSQLRSLGESLIPVQWLAVVLDEGQYIKNPSSQTTQVARALRADHRLVLSGTPIENRLLDLWSLMSFAMPGVLSSRAQFAKLYDTKGDPLARRRLAARVRPFLIRRTKTQVAKDLPDRVEEDLFCELEGEQKLLYRAELKRAQQNLLKIQTKQQLNEERFNFLTSLLRLRQICCHPALVSPDCKESGAKMEALLEQIEPLMEEGHKVLVFSQFVELLALLKPAIEEREWPLFHLTGETENRGALVEKFQAAEGGAVFLISLKAGGFGLNLTAASYVVLFDPWWNPAVENQAIDRTHRIGQVNKVIAYRLLIKDSVEEKIRSLQKQKSALALDVLGEEKFSQGLSLEDLQFLLAD